MTARPAPRLHLVRPLDVVADDAYVEVAIAAARGGVDAVHVRLPGRPAADVLAIARALREQLPPAVAVIVNDRLDVALAAGVDGVQLGEHGLPVADARSVAADRLLIGRSVHDLDGARRAAATGADYLLAGHVYATTSHAGEPGRGLDWLREIAAVAVPVIAIGGITAERIGEVMAAGAWGVALGREILLAGDPGAAARAAWERLARQTATP